MRAFLLGAKVAALVSLVLACALGGILWLFFRVAGRELYQALTRLHAFEGVATVGQIEALLAAGHDLDGARVQSLLGRDRARLGLSMAVAPTASAPWVGGAMVVAGRRCWVEDGPRGRVRVPILFAGTTVADLTVGGAGHAHAIHLAFRRGVGHIALATLLGIVLVTAYLIKPLRRMARSMDRVAAGDLAHRVAVSGTDDVAAMGVSFNAMADRIGAMVQGQKELLADVSHELRSPLARMNVTLALMRDSASDATANDARLVDLETEVETIDSLVGEVLLASRFDLGAVPVERVDLSLARVVEEAWRLVTPAAERSPALTLAAGAERVSADPALVTRIFRNLFENAARHAEGGSIQVSAEQREQRVVITVADDGPGVEAAARERLFEPFFRADPARAHRAGHGGVGLGLMIVRRAVEAHGGRVAAEPALAGGLAVVFDLPA